MNFLGREIMKESIELFCIHSHEFGFFQFAEQYDAIPGLRNFN
jgi:hypothetical protein